jgi:hypothetical protein
MKLQNAILHYGTKVVLLSHRDIYDLTVYIILLVHVFQSQLLQLQLIMFQLIRGQGQGRQNFVLEDPIPAEGHR